MYNTFLYSLLKSPLISNRASSRKGSLNTKEVEKLKSILLKSLFLAAIFAISSLIIFFILKNISLSKKEIIIFSGISLVICAAVIKIFIKYTDKYLYSGYIFLFFASCMFAGLVFLNIYTDFVTIKFITNTYITLIVTIYFTGTRIITYNNKNNQLFSAVVVTFIASIVIYAIILFIMYKSSILYKIYAGNMTAYILSDIIIIFLASCVYVINMEYVLKSISFNISQKKQTYYAFSLVFLLLWFIIIPLKYIIYKKNKRGN